MFTTGKFLKSAREQKGYTIQQVEKFTKIRSKNLDAIEHSKWNQFSSRTYIVGMVRSYGKFLKIDETQLLGIFRREYEEKNTAHKQNVIQKKHFTPPIHRTFRIITLILIILLITYFGYQLTLFFSPPRITLISPSRTEFKNEKKIELVGKTNKESIVTVNGERVYQDKENIFKIFVPLVNRENTVLIEVVGSNGKKTVLKRTFMKI
ncbi:MAG TPA: helix-turn-helix domain-containing protein [Patescibacteria group bacterium]|nr:helix-turn-helix domain-containing protein [Patescibacteria group bacterium]